jgi:hypothetical protein
MKHHLIAHIEWVLASVWYNILRGTTYIIVAHKTSCPKFCVECHAPKSLMDFNSCLLLCWNTCVSLWLGILSCQRGIFSANYGKPMACWLFKFFVEVLTFWRFTRLGTTLFYKLMYKYAICWCRLFNSGSVTSLISFDGSVYN